MSDPEDHNQTGERLQRVLAARGVASRRKSEELIREGRVSVNGKVVTELGTRVDPNASIKVDGKVIRKQPYRYLMLNKPSGYITTRSDERDRRTVMELVPDRPPLTPVGRLDRETEGLLLFTNDGEVANRVMHPRYQLTKEYVITTPYKPPESVMRRVREGIEIDGKLVRPHEFRIMRETHNGVMLSIVVHEGMNRVVRRMMEAVGIEVTALRRDRIGPLSVAGIPRGAYRDLTEGELANLLEAVHLERGEPDSSRGKSQASNPRSRRGNS
jgi:23S rRNA pseudouridine2605 synthase